MEKAKQLRFSLRFVDEIKSPLSGLAGDEDVCNIKSRQFTIAIFRALKLDLASVQDLSSLCVDFLLVLVVDSTN